MYTMNMSIYMLIGYYEFLYNHEVLGFMYVSYIVNICAGICMYPPISLTRIYKNKCYMSRYA